MLYRDKRDFEKDLYTGANKKERRINDNINRINAENVMGHVFDIQ
jgi:hypothetical protein